MEKKRLPLTYFERLYGCISVLDPDFFTGSVPDLARMQKRLGAVRASEATKKRHNKEWLRAAADYHALKLAWFQTLIRQWTLAIDQGNKMKKLHGTCDLKKLPPEAVDATADVYWLAGTALTDPDGTDVKKRAWDRDLLDRLYWTMHRFHRRGKKTFRIEEQLTHELFLTDVSKVDASFLQLPFPAMCFHLPYNQKLTMRRDVIEWVYVTERLALGNKEHLRLLDCVFISRGGAISIAGIELKPSGDLLDMIQAYTKGLIPSPLALQENTELISFLTAALLYMNSRDAIGVDIHPAVFQKKQDSTYPVCAVGYGIEINRHLHTTSGGGTGEGSPMHILKWTVRGHFRKLSSDRWKEKKTLWIRPYLKGQERGNEDQKIKPTFYDVK